MRCTQCDDISRSDAGVQKLPFAIGGTSADTNENPLRHFPPDNALEIIPH